MAKVHEYVLVLPDGKYEVTKSNGPICVEQARQEIGGYAQAFDPQLGDGFTAQIHEDSGQIKLTANTVFDGISGKVLIGRAHGTAMWGLSVGQRDEVVARLRLPR